jgi:hypothetical protein
MKDFGNVPTDNLFSDRVGSWAELQWVWINEDKYVGLDWVMIGMDGRQTANRPDLVVMTAGQRIEVILGIDMRNNPANNFQTDGNRNNSGLGFLGTQGWELQPVLTDWIEDTQSVGNGVNNFDSTWVADPAGSMVRYYLYTKTFDAGEVITLPSIGDGNDNCNYLILLRAL